MISAWCADRTLINPIIVHIDFDVAIQNAFRTVIQKYKDDIELCNCFSFSTCYAFKGVGPVRPLLSLKILQFYKIIKM